MENTLYNLLWIWKIRWGQEKWPGPIQFKTNEYNQQQVIQSINMVLNAFDARKFFVIKRFDQGIILDLGEKYKKYLTGDDAVIGITPKQEMGK